MDFLDLVHERMDSLERTRQETKHAVEARRLGMRANWSPLAIFDSALIRASKRANERQERREGRTNHQGELAS